MKTNTIVKAVGIVVGGIALLTLISRHPVNIILVLVGAAIYFVADRLL